MSEIWINDDGLVIRFGTEEAVFRNIGAYRSHGPRRFVEVIVQSDELPAHDETGPTILNDQFAIPAGAFIESVEIVTYDDFDSAADAMTFNLGLVSQDRTTGLSADADALIDAATQAEMNTGGVNIAGWVGDAVGTVLEDAKLLTWQVETATATDGHATIRVRWSVPPKDEDTLVWDKSA